MKETKLIIVAGMSGTGKSTTAQNISYLYTKNGITHEWYHEEMYNHPIRWANGGEFNIGDCNTAEGMLLNIADYFERWKVLIAQMTEKGGVYVLEGCLYQSIIRYFLPAAYPHEKIIKFYDEFMKILAPANPYIIHLYRPNVTDSFEKAFTVRGNGWKNVIIKGRDNYYFEDEAEYQILARQIFGRYSGKKLSIDTSQDDWDNYLTQICEFLKLEYHKRDYLTVSQPERYTGCYEWRNGNHTESVNIICENGVLYASPPWFTHIKMNAIAKNTFELTAFPITFKYLFENGDVYIEVCGNYDWGIVGKMLKQIKQVLS